MRSRGSLTGPLVLIMVGFVFLIHAFSPNFRISELVANYWPYGLILWGLVALVELCIRFLGNRPIPRNGITGGGWVTVVILAFIGSSVFGLQRHEPWFLRQVGFSSGFEAFGDQHQYPIETITRDAGSTPRVILQDFHGDAKISGTDSTTVTVGGQKTISSFDKQDANKADTQSPVEVIADGNTVTIRCHQDISGIDASVSANLDVSIPKGASVQASDSNGSIDISSISGDVVLTGGSMEDVRLDGIGGNVKLDAHRTNSVHGINLKGSVDLHSGGSDVDLESVAGQVTIGGDFTGTISLRGLAKPVRLESMRTQLDARQINGYVRLDRGSFDAKDLVGPVKLSTHNTDVTLAGFTDNLDLEVDRGDIELRPEHTALGHIAVHAHSGDIELAIPAAAQFSMKAGTANGEISNEFGDGLQQTSDGRSARLEGAVGSGPDVNLVTEHGRITVRKATGETLAENKDAAAQ